MHDMQKLPLETYCTRAVRHQEQHSELTPLLQACGLANVNDAVQTFLV